MPRPQARPQRSAPGHDIAARHRAGRRHLRAAPVAPVSTPDGADLGLRGPNWVRCIPGDPANGRFVYEDKDEHLLDDLRESRALALATNQPSAAIQATMVMARLLGFMVKRVETCGAGTIALRLPVGTVIAATVGMERTCAPPPSGWRLSTACCRFWEGSRTVRAGAANR